MLQCPSAPGVRVPFFQSVNLRSNYYLQISDAFIALGQSRGQLLHLFNPPRGRELNKMFEAILPSHISEGIGK